MMGLRTRLRRGADRLAWTVRDLGLRRRAVAVVACDVAPTSGPWGGGNQWLVQTMRYLQRSGYSVRFDLRRPADVLFLTNAKPDAETSFDLAAARRYLAAHPECVCVQRVNDSDAHRSSVGIDGFLAEANALATHTVFLSAWLRDYHAARWFDASKPHSVIHNGADSRWFHPVGGATWDSGGAMRLVTHHWSSNAAKGFDVYATVDRLIARGELPGFELWIIGRWPDTTRWQAATLIGPRRAPELGALLRRCHVYLTASRWEAGGMHFLEGVQCGLPAVFHEDGGGIAEVGHRVGLSFRDDPVAALTEMRRVYPRLREAAIEAAPSGDAMALRYRELLQRLLAERAPR